LAVSHGSAVLGYRCRGSDALAGGTWDRIEPLVERMRTEHALEVTVYDLTAPPGR
jgi:hypothetical protein